LATNNGLWHYENNDWEVFNHWHNNIPSTFDFGEFWSVEEVNGEVYFSGFELYKIVDNEVINLTTDYPMCTFYASGNIISHNDKVYVTDFFTFIATFENNSTTVLESASGNFPHSDGFQISVDQSEQLNVLFKHGEKYFLEGNNWTSQNSPLLGQLDGLGQENFYYYFHGQDNQEWFSYQRDLYKVASNSYEQTLLSDNPIFLNNSKRFAAASDNSMYVLEHQYTRSLSRFHPAEGWSQVDIPEEIDGANIFPRTIAVNAEDHIILAASSQLAKYDGANWSLVSNFPLDVCHLISTPTDEGKYYVANFSEIAFFDGSNWSILGPPFTQGSPNLPNEIKTIATAPNGDLWVSRKYDFLRYDSNNQWTVFDENDTNVITSSAAIVIDFEEDGTVWTTAAGDGILRFDGANWTNFDDDLGVAGCRQLTVMPNGDIWAATFEGLAKFNGSSWDLWTEDNCELRGNHVLQVNHSTDGTLWINMDIEGIQLFNNNAFSSGVFENNSSQLTLSPNPATDFIFIENFISKNVRYQILNTIGQVVKAGISQNGMVNIASLSGGFYFITTKTEDGYFIGTIVKS